MVNEFDEAHGYNGAVHKNRFKLDNRRPVVREIHAWTAILAAALCGALFDREILPSHVWPANG
jgi:hypothetical protein